MDGEFVVFPKKRINPWRGSLLPLGCAAVVKNLRLSRYILLNGLGLLRSPAGASSLATGFIVVFK
jgi:hypothetical protein